MSAKKAKKKITGYDIGYRVVMALAAICVPIAAYFANMIYYVVESPLFKLLSQVQGNTNDDGSTYGYIGFKLFVDKILPLLNESADNKTSITSLFNELSDIKTPLILTIVFFALAILLALSVAVSAAASNSRKLHFGLSTVGLASVIAMFVSFRYVSAPIVSGTVNLGNFFDSALMKVLLPYVASVSTFNLSSAWVIMLVIFIGLTILSGANLLIDAGESSKVKNK